MTLVTGRENLLEQSSGFQKGNPMRRHHLIALVVVAALGLSGCVAAADPTANAPAEVEPAAPTNTAPANTEPANIPEQGTPEWAALSQDEQTRACETRDTMVGCMLTWGDCWSTTFAAADDPMAVAGEVAIVPFDRGPREYARGEAVFGAGGTPVAYVVAAGDIPEFVADRFCTHLAYLHGINSVRRASLAGNLFVGDTLNLDATTIFTVGDENGLVSAGSPPVPHPPQR